MKIFVKRSMKFGYFSSLNTARRCVCLVVLLVVQAVALFAESLVSFDTGGCTKTQIHPAHRYVAYRV